MCIKVKLMLRDLNNTQKAENVFIGMLGVTFLFWLLYTAPFILVDTLLDSCFQKTGLHAAAYILNWTKVCSCHHPDIFEHEGSLALQNLNGKFVHWKGNPFPLADLLWLWFYYMVQNHLCLPCFLSPNTV